MSLAAAQSTDSSAEACDKIRQQISRDSHLPTFSELLTKSSYSCNYSYGGMDFLSLESSKALPDAVLREYSNVISAVGKDSSEMPFINMGLLCPTLEYAWISLGSKFFLWRYVSSKDAFLITLPSACENVLKVGAVGLTDFDASSSPKIALCIACIGKLVVVWFDLADLIANGVPTSQCSTTREILIDNDCEEIVTSTSAFQSSLFLGTKTDNIYELFFPPDSIYRPGLICHSKSFLTAFVPAWLLGHSPTAVYQIAVDENRSRLWVLLDDSSVTLYHILLHNGTKSLKKCSSMKDVTSQSIVKTSVKDSSWYASDKAISLFCSDFSNAGGIDCVIFTSNGLRIFISIVDNTQLTIHHVRAVPAEAEVAQSVISPPFRSSLRFDKSMYLKGASFIASASVSNRDNQSSKICSSYLDPRAIFCQSKVFPPEHYSELVLDGKIWEIGFEYPASSVDDSSATFVEPLQLSGQRAKIVVLTSMGVWVFEKSSLNECISKVLSDSSDSTNAIFSFLSGKEFPCDQALAIIWSLAICNLEYSDIIGSILHRFILQSSERRTDIIQHLISSIYINIGRIVRPLADINILKLGIEVSSHISSMELFLNRLQNFISRYQHEFPCRQVPLFNSVELKVLNAILNTVILIREIISFISLCIDYDILSSRSDQTVVTLFGILGEISPRESNKGNASISLLYIRSLKELSLSLIQKHISMKSPLDGLCYILGQRCPHLFSFHDLMLYRGQESLTLAENAKYRNLVCDDNGLLLSFLEKALSEFLDAVPSIISSKDPKIISNIVSEMNALCFHRGAIVLVLKCIDEVSKQSEDCTSINAPEYDSGTLVSLCVDILCKVCNMSPSDLINDPTSYFRSCVSTSLSSKSSLLKYAVFDFLINEGQIAVLMDSGANHAKDLELFLNEKSFYSRDGHELVIAPYCEVFANFLSKRGNYDKAAELRFRIATSSELYASIFLFRKLNLDQRLDFLRIAILDSKSARANATRIQDILDVALMQSLCLESLKCKVEEPYATTSSKSYEAKILVDQLQTQLMDISFLFHRVVLPFDLSFVGLDILAASTKTGSPNIMFDFVGLDSDTAIKALAFKFWTSIIKNTRNLPDLSKIFKEFNERHKGASDKIVPLAPLIELLVEEFDFRKQSADTAGLLNICKSIDEKYSSLAEAILNILKSRLFEKGDHSQITSRFLLHLLVRLTFECDNSIEYANSLYQHNPLLLKRVFKLLLAKIDLMKEEIPEALLVQYSNYMNKLVS